MLQGEKSALGNFRESWKIEHEEQAKQGELEAVNFEKPPTILAECEGILRN
jgi:hypothetical protein